MSVCRCRTFPFRGVVVVASSTAMGVGSFGFSFGSLSVHNEITRQAKTRQNNQTKKHTNTGSTVDGRRGQPDNNNDDDDGDDDDDDYSPSSSSGHRQAGLAVATADGSTSRHNPACGRKDNTNTRRWRGGFAGRRGARTTLPSGDAPLAVCPDAEADLD